MSQYYYNPFGYSDVNEARQREFEKQQRIKQEKHEIRMISLAMGCAIIAYLLVQTFAVSFLSAAGLHDLYQSNAVFQYGFTAIAVSFAAVAVPFGIVALVNRKRYKSPVIPSRRLKAPIAFAWISFGMLACCVCQIAMNFIILFFKSVFKISSDPAEMLKPDSIFSCVLSVIAIAVVPAICEEFAMRCCSLQLLKRYGKGFGVVAVSIVFGLLHGNFSQFIFAFLIGLILGFVTVKTDSIVPAVFIHALNNGFSVLQYLVLYVADENAANMVTVGVYLLWIAVGALATLYLFSKKEFAKGRKECDSVLTTGQKFTSFLFPWMIIPFLALIVISILSVKSV